MNQEFKEISISDFEIKAIEGKNFIEGYASTFGNLDAHNDIVVSGAFKKSLRNRKPKMLWQHRIDKVIGVYEKAKEDDKGLFVRGRFSNTPLGNEVAELSRDRAVDSMSIGFSVTEAEFDNKKGIRKIKEVELFEISVVTFPANDKAKIITAKTSEDIRTIREFEKFLRDAGYSREQATAIASGGFKAIDTERDAEVGEVNGELFALLKQFNQQLGVSHAGSGHR